MKWLLRYKNEALYLELDDKLRGSLLDFELDIEIRLLRYVSVGFVTSRLSMNLELSKSNFRGGVFDLYQG